MKRWFRWLLSGLLLVLGNALIPTVRAADAPRPNVLVILTDDQRFDAMSCAGHPFMKTPNMDRLAKEGARFTNAFVTTSLCSPSRASLLSGLYAHSHKVLNNFTDYPNELASYARLLHDAGYLTAYFGKWHMGEQTDDPRPGFDHWMSHKGQGNYYDTEFNINGKREVVKGYYTSVITDYVIQWLMGRQRQPWLLILGHKAPHGGPIVPEEKYAKAFDAIDIRKPANADAFTDGKPAWLKESVPTWHGVNGPLYGLKDYSRFVRSYLATILSVDESLGRILETLRATGQLDNTIIIFTSDNGFALGEHGRVDKRTMYEESIRVPLLVRYPKLIPQPKAIDEMVLSVDLAPSILDMCGVKGPANLHGTSWMRLLQGNSQGWRTSFYYEYNYEKEFPYTPNVRGVRTRGWKYIRYPHGDGKADRHKAELYNLMDDPLETQNLIDDPQYANQLKMLEQELARLQQATGALPDRMPIDEGIHNVLPNF